VYKYNKKNRIQENIPLICSQIDKHQK